MSKQSQLVKNTLIIAAGKLSTQFLTFLLLPIYTIFLSPVAFGQMDMIMIYLALLAPSLTVQMEMAVFRHLIDARGAQDEIHKSIASSSLVLFVGSFIGAVAILILGLLFNAPYIWHIVGLFLSMVLTGYILQLSRGLGRSDLFSVVSIITGLINISLTCLTLIVFGLGVEGILLSGIVANLIGSGVLIAKTGYIKSLRMSYVNKKEVKALLNYAWPLVPNHISYWGINGISRTIILTALGLASVGIYAAASRFSLIYSSLYSIFLMSWTEVASIHIKNNKDNFISETSDAVVRLFGSLSIVIIAGVGILFPLFVSVDFADARQYVPLLILGAFFSSLAMHYGSIYLAVRKTKQVAIITIQAMIISSILTLLGTAFIGLYAPAIAIIITYIYLVIRRHFDVQKYVVIKYKKMTFPILFIFALAVLSLYYVDIFYVSILSIVISLLGFLLINRSSLKSIQSMVLRRVDLRKNKKSST